MSFENPIINGAETPADKDSKYDSMSFEEIERDPECSSVLQEQALEYLKTEDKEYFDREFTGELDNEGYLIRKDGQGPYAKPSQNIAAGAEKVLSMTREALRERDK